MNLLVHRIILFIKSSISTEITLDSRFFLLKNGLLFVQKWIEINLWITYLNEIYIWICKNYVIWLNDIFQKHFIRKFLTIYLIFNQAVEPKILWVFGFDWLVILMSFFYMTQIPTQKHKIFGFYCLFVTIYLMLSYI